MIAQHVLAILWLALVVLIYARLLRRDETIDSISTKYRALVISSGACFTISGIIFWLGAFSGYANWFVPSVYPVLDWTGSLLVIAGGGLIVWSFMQRLQRLEGADAPSVDDSVVQSGSIYNSEQTSVKTLEASSEITSKSASEIPRSSLASLNTLRIALSQPYPFVELARIALDGMAEAGSVSCGALYIHNESTGELTIAATQNLAAETERALERLSLKDAILAEVFASGEPMISGEFLALRIGAELSLDKYPGKTALLIPILRNSEPLGLVALFAESSLFLSNSQMNALSQMADIVADKFVNVKLRGELTRTKNRGADREASRARITQAFSGAFECISDSSSSSSAAHNAVHNDASHDNVLNAVCQRLVGIGFSDAVALIERTADGSELNLLAVSSEFPEISAGFQSAALKALERQALVLLSREKQVSNSSISSHQLEKEREPMALIAPMGSGEVQIVDGGSSPRPSVTGMLFWNQSGRFYLEPEELQDFAEWLHPLNVAVDSFLARKRSRGSDEMLHIVQELLKPDSDNDSGSDFEAEESRLNQFVSSLRDAFGLLESCLVFKRSESGQLRPVLSYGVPFDTISALVILPGEGSLGRSAALGCSVIERGAIRIAEASTEYDMLNRDGFGAGFSNLGVVKAQVLAPVMVNGGARYVLSFYFENEALAEEVSRALSPLCELLSLVLSVRELQSDGHRILPPRIVGHQITGGNATASIVNDINNDLSTIIGNCQLAAEDPNLSGAVEKLLHLIIGRAESSAQLLSGEHFSGNEEVVSGSAQAATIEIEQSFSLTEELRRFASESVVGGQILLTEGKAREVEFDLESDFSLNLAPKEAKNLVERLCHGLSALADEREIVTVSVYQSGGADYLDISRRWRNLPSMKHIGSYARFDGSGSGSGSGALDISDETLQALDKLGVEIAVDKRSSRPAYITLRSVKVANDKESTELGYESKPRILAIDDQSMILDLLGAMCDSLGYHIDTFESPSRAIAAFERGAHDIVITDVAMPQLSGWEVASAIKKLRPETYLMFITGWEEGLSEERLRAYDINEVLKKPFRLEQLTESLEEAQRLFSASTSG